MAKVELKTREELNINIGSMKVHLKKGVNNIELNERDIERIVTHLGANKDFNEIIKIGGTTLKTRLEKYEGKDKEEQQQEA